MDTNLEEGAGVGYTWGRRMQTNLAAATPRMDHVRIKGIMHSPELGRSRCNAHGIECNSSNGMQQLKPQCTTHLSDLPVVAGFSICSA